MNDSKPSQADDVRTVPHLVQTVASALGHSTRHSVEARNTDDMQSKNFNLDHSIKHLGEAQEHTQKLIEALKATPQYQSEFMALDGNIPKSAHLENLKKNTAWQQVYGNKGVKK